MPFISSCWLSCCWWVLFLCLSLLLSYFVTCPKGTDSYCPLPAFPLPFALSPRIMRPLFHLANLKEKLQREASLLLNQPAPSKDCDSWCVTVFIFPVQFLACPGSWPASTQLQCWCNGTGRVKWAEAQGRAHKYWDALKLRALLQKKRRDNLKKHFCII